MRGTIMRHTKLPWKVEKISPKSEYTNIIDEDGEEICSMDYRDYTNIDQGNAEFIVKACNSHYELLEVAKELLFNSDNDGYWATNIELLRNKAREAIQKTKGES